MVLFHRYTLFTLALVYLSPCDLSHVLGKTVPDLMRTNILHLLRCTHYIPFLLYRSPMVSSYFTLLVSYPVEQARKQKHVGGRA
jgi:hypothetical protein